MEPEKQKPELPLDEPDEGPDIPAEVSAAETLVEEFKASPPVEDWDIFLPGEEEEPLDGLFDEPAQKKKTKKKTPPPAEEPAPKPRPKTKKKTTVRKVRAPEKKPEKKSQAVKRKKIRPTSVRRVEDGVPSSHRTAVIPKDDRRERRSKEATREISQMELAVMHEEETGIRPTLEEEEAPRKRKGKKKKTEKRSRVENTSSKKKGSPEKRSRVKEGTRTDEPQARGKRSKTQSPSKTERRSKSETGGRKDRGGSRGRRKSRHVRDFAFRGSGFRYLLIAYPRSLLLLLALACVALGAVVWAKGMIEAGETEWFTKIPRFDLTWPEQILKMIPYDVTTLPAMPWISLAPAGLFLFLALLVHLRSRAFRLRNTYVYNNALVYADPLRSRLVQGGLGLLLILLTGGLAAPWVYARAVRRSYRLCTLKRRGDGLDFDGSGFQVLGLGVLSLLLFPVALVTLGLFWPVIAIRWIDWEQEHLVVPTEQRHLVHPHFTGHTKSLLGLLFSWTFFGLLTAGLSRPFQRTAVWAWIADQTELPDRKASEDDEEEESGGEEEDEGLLSDHWN